MFVCLSVLSSNNLKPLRAVKNIFIQEIFILRLTLNPGLALTGFRTTRPWGPFLEGSEMFSHPESVAKISNLMITELFYSHIFNMNRGSLHTRSFRRIRFSFLDTDELKMALQARKVSRAFEKRAAVLLKQPLFIFPRVSVH